MRNILSPIMIEISPIRNREVALCCQNLKVFFNKTFIILMWVWTGCASSAFAQNLSNASDEAENLHIMTNQNIFFAGEKLWFGLKLLKNHDSYRFSKLVYLDIYSPDHSLIHHEKLLLDPQEMTYGDVILPDNLVEGEYKIYAYTKWMLNFPSYPIASKSVLVKRFNSDNEEQEEIQLFYSENEGPSRELMFFHTGDKPLLVEIENAQGRQEAVFEEIPPFTVFNTKMQLEEPKNIIWGKEKKSISPSEIRIVDSRLEINSGIKYHTIFSHTDLNIIEKKDDHTQIDFSSQLYEGLNLIQITLLDEQNKVVAHKFFNRPANSGMTISTPRSIQTGQSFTANIRTSPTNATSGMAWVKSSEPAGLPEIIQVINDPSWKKITEDSKSIGNYPKTKLEIENDKTLEYRMEFLPLMEYDPLTTILKDKRPDLFLYSPISSLPDFQDYTEKEMKRRVFHEHFEYDATVSVPVSPYMVDYTYDVQDYEGYKSMEEFMKEVVSQVRVRKNRATDQNEIRLFNPNMARKNFKSLPLLMIDFYQVTDPSVILTYDINQIDRIEVIYLRNTIDETNLGRLSENGIVALFTKKNDYQLKYNISKSQYILKDLNVPRVMGKEMDHPESSANVTLSKPQSWHPAIILDRGRSQFRTSIIDEPGKIKLEAWIFNGVYPTRLQSEVEVR